MWVLGAVVVVLALLILPYFQKWMVQRSEIAAAQAGLARTHSEVIALQEEKRRWNDPDYVKAQARERLHFVMPGETGYVVVDPEPAQPAATDPGSVAAARAARGGHPWFGDLWESVKIAGADRGTSGG